MKSKTTNPVVANALGAWDNLMEIYLDRAALAGKMGDTAESAAWFDKANTLAKIMKRADIAHNATVDAPCKEQEEGENTMTSTNPIVQMALNAAQGVPPDLWEKLKRTSIAYKVAGDLKNGKSVDECIMRWRSSIGSQIPGRIGDGAIAVSVLEEMKRRGINQNAADAKVVRNENFNVGDKVIIRGVEHYDMKGTITKKAPNGWWVSWGIDKSGVLPEKYLIKNTSDTVAKNGKDTTIGSTEIYDLGNGSISYVLGWKNNEGAISGSGTKDRVIAKAKTDIATLKAKTAEMEKVLAYLQKM